MLIVPRDFYTNGTRRHSPRSQDKIEFLYPNTQKKLGTRHNRD